jgi:hypothetical protein
VTLAALNAILTAWATVLDAKHASALMRALGAKLSPGQLGSRGGAGAFRAARGCSRSRPEAGLPSRQHFGLVATVLGTLPAVAALTTVTAGIGARRPAVETLQAETA